jgi:cell division protease FtsH
MFRNLNQGDRRENDDPEESFPSSSWMRWIPYIILIIGSAIILFLWGPLGGTRAEGAQINYSAFREQVRDGNVSRVTVTEDKVRGELISPRQTTTDSGESVEYDRFFTYLPPTGDDSLLPLLEEQNVEIQAEPASDTPWLGILINLAPFLLLLLLIVPALRRMQSTGRGIFSMGQSQAKLYSRERTRTTFDDVAGLQSPKTELKEIIAFLKDPEKFQRLGGEMPRGILLVGPPGTGKTLLARAVAGEANVPFYSITGSNFMEMFVGVGASRVRDLFNEAKKVAPSIVFIDELDSIGRTRGAGLGGGHDEREQTLNQLLSELDGFEPNESVIVMAATNRPDILDKALLRPGRFDRRITVDLPAMKDRQHILEIHARNKPLAEDVDLESLARGTPGFSGADLENLLNEAALLAARNGKERIEGEDIEQARDKVLMGLERTGLSLTEDEIQMLAYHEGGHALLAALLPYADPIHKVTIVPRGRAMGVTQQLPERDKYIYPKEYLLDRITVMMGGRAAEILVFDTTTSGAENDLKQATQMARKMVLDWGMSERFGSIGLGDQDQPVFLGEEISRPRQYSEKTAEDADAEIKSILDQAFDKAKTMLGENRDHLDELAEKLMEREEILGDEVKALIGEVEVASA